MEPSTPCKDISMRPTGWSKSGSISDAGCNAKPECEGQEGPWSPRASQCVGGSYGGTKSPNRPQSLMLQRGSYDALAKTSMKRGLCGLFFMSTHLSAHLRENDEARRRRGGVVASRLVAFIFTAAH